MQRVDPTGRRLREAIKRMQMLGSKPGLDALPLMRFWSTMMDLYNHPRTGKRAKAAIAAIVGSEPELMERLVDDADVRRAQSMSFEELAEDALSAKSLHG
jgi:hypothetical protein